MAAPLSLIFPAAGVAALIAYVFKESESEASTSGRLLTLAEWEKSKEEWYKHYGTRDLCQSGYKLDWLPFDGHPATFVCTKLPEVASVQNVAPGETPSPAVLNQASQAAASAAHANEPAKVAPAEMLVSPAISHADKPDVMVPTETPPALSKPGMAQPKQPVVVETPAGTAVVAKSVSRKEWEADKKRKIKSNNCAPGTEPVFDEYGQTWAEYVCKPRIVNRDEWEKDKKRKLRDNNCKPGFEPKFADYNKSWAEYTCEPTAADVLKQNQKESTIKEVPRKEFATKKIPSADIISEKTSSIKEIKSAPKEASLATKVVVENKKQEQKKKVSLADWQADMKRKQLDNNCADGYKAVFDPYSGTWAEYKCVPSGQALAQKPASQTPIKKVEQALYEPDATPFVNDALKSKDSQKIRDAADTLSRDYPKASAFLYSQASKYEMTFEPENIEFSKPKSKKTETAKELPKSASPVAKIISKKDWEADKASKLKNNNCDEGYEPIFDSYNKDWAKYVCNLSPKVSKQMAMLKAEGIEDDMAEKIAIFLSDNPSPEDARSYSNNFKSKKPKAYARLRQYADNTEHIKIQIAKGKPTEPSKVVEAAKASSNPSDLLDHAKTLDAQGKPKTAALVKDKAKKEAEKQGKKILDDKEANKLYEEAKNAKLERQSEISDILRAGGYNKKADSVEDLMLQPSSKPTGPTKVETKKVVDDSGKAKSLPVVVSTKTYEERKKEEDKKADEKKKAEAKKAKPDEKQKEQKAEVKPFKSEEEFFKDLDEEKPGDAEKKKAKKKDSVSGYSDDTGSIRVSSPIDRVDDEQWLSFVKAMQSGHVDTITPNYSLGLFGFGMRRLADYGLVRNPRQTEYHGNTVWAGDWISPWDLSTFLNDENAQYKLFENDMSSKADYVRENDAVGKLIEGRKATLSGLLAVAFKTTEKSFNHWLNATSQDRKQFPATMKLFEKVNGIF